MHSAASVLTLAVGLATATSEGQVAITEFLNNPDGADKGREWVELFNFSETPIDLDGWTLLDEDTDSVTFPPFVLASGGYVVFVSGGIGGLDAATAKAVFETEWLGGTAHQAVIGVESMALANGGDELVLADPERRTIWSLAYADDETAAHGTFLTETNDRSVRTFGSKAAPGVVRHGDDNGIRGFAGYEDNAFTPDPLAYESDIGRLAEIFGDDYATVAEPSVGSPLLGDHRVIRAGDVDGNGAVDVLDLLSLLRSMGPCAEPCPPLCAADFNADCAVGVEDLLVVLGNWD